MVDPYARRGGRPHVRIPRWVVFVMVIAVAASWIPLVLIARARTIPSGQTRIHPIQDMDVQPYFQAQEYTKLFADHRAMRPPIPGTVARGEARLDDHYYQGRVNGEWATQFPSQIEITPELLEQGREQFGIYCSICHGHAGYGDGMVARRVTRLLNTNPQAALGWVPPADLHTLRIRQMPVGKIFHTITYGIRSMPAYGTQVSVHNRWAIIAYLQALQLSQHAKLEELPKDMRPPRETLEKAQDGESENGEDADQSPQQTNADATGSA